MNNPKKVIVAAFVRMQPPHIGHQNLINEIHKIASEYDADHLIGVSRSFDTNRNPIPPNVKLDFLHKIFPNTNFHLVEKKEPTLVGFLKYLGECGYSSIHFLAGNDRFPDMVNLIENYNESIFHFSEIFGHTLNRSSISGTKMRNYVAGNDLKSFYKYLPKNIDETLKTEIFSTVKKGLILKEYAGDMVTPYFTNVSGPSEIITTLKTNKQANTKIQKPKKMKEDSEYQIKKDGPISVVFNKNDIVGSIVDPELGTNDKKKLPKFSVLSKNWGKKSTKPTKAAAIHWLKQQHGELNGELKGEGMDPKEIKEENELTHHYYKNNSGHVATLTKSTFSDGSTEYSTHLPKQHKVIGFKTVRHTTQEKAHKRLVALGYKHTGETEKEGPLGETTSLVANLQGDNDSEDYKTDKVSPKNPGIKIQLKRTLTGQKNDVLTFEPVIVTKDEKKDLPIIGIKKRPDV